MNSTKASLSIVDLDFEVTFKDIRHLHISVNPPDGHVKVSAPFGVSEEMLRHAVTKRLRWIRNQQSSFSKISRQSPREAQAGESHYLWGKRFVLDVRYHSGRPLVRTQGTTLILQVAPSVSDAKRAQSLENWFRDQLRGAVKSVVAKWEPRLGLNINGLRLRRMKTKWGSCNIEKRIVTLNTELVAKAPQFLEYVVLHELVHLLARGHGKDFTDVMDELLPDWRQRRKQLNSTIHGNVNWGAANESSVTYKS